MFKLTNKNRTLIDNIFFSLWSLRENKWEDKMGKIDYPSSQNEILFI